MPGTMHQGPLLCRIRRRRIAPPMGAIHVPVVVQSLRGRFGLAQLRFLDQMTAGRVIFGPDDVEPLLGLTPLESVGITVDPVSQTVKRLPAVPLKPTRRVVASGSATPPRGAEPQIR